MPEKQKHSCELILFPLAGDRAIINQAEASLSETELKRAARFVYPRHQRRFTLARAGLRKCLAQRLDCQPQEIQLQYGEHGKPSLDPNYHDGSLKFNLSHTKDIALLAITHEYEVGVDIEYIQDDVAGLDIAERYFCANETAVLKNLTQQQQPTGFFNGWTRKEALLKALGMGLNFPLQDCEVNLLPDEDAKICCVIGYPEAADHWSIHSFCPEPGLVAAVVVCGPLDDWVIQKYTDNIV